MEKEKIYVFIDSQNLNVSIIEQGWKLDFSKFHTYLIDRFKISKAFLFIGFVNKNIGLYEELNNIGYVLVFKPTFQNKENEIKGNVDAELVLCAMLEFNNYDKAIIVSGDGDFYCLLDYLYKNNKLLRLIIPNKHKYSFLLKKFLSRVIFLSDKKFRNSLNKKERH